MLETVIRKGESAAELLDCLRQHGICVVPAFYPPEFASTLSRSPDSAFLAEGSAVTVYRPGACPAGSS